MKKVALIIAFLSAFTAPVLAQKARIEAVNAKWVELFNKSDFEGLAQLYTADAKRAIGVKPETTPAIEDWPVVVHFDPRDGRVFRIKKGDVWTGTTSAP